MSQPETQEQQSDHTTFTRELSHESVTFAPGALGQQEHNIYFGVENPVVAELHLAGNDFVIFKDIAGQGVVTPDQSDYFLMPAYKTQDEVDGKPVFNMGSQVIDIKTGKTLELGRTELVELGLKEYERATQMSRKHLRITANEDGTLTLEDTSSNHTTVKYAEQLNQTTSEKATDIEADTIPRADLQALHAEAQTRPVDQYEGVLQDPAFKELAAPYNNQLKTLYEMQKEALTEVEADYKGAEDSRGSDYHDRIRKISNEYRERIQSVRDQLQEAVRPMLTERLEQATHDTGPAYLKSGELVTNERRDLVTKRGKKVAHIAGGGRYVSSSVAPRLGQFTTPSRFYDWAGRSNALKENQKTGIKTTSPKHIVELASAIVAGNFTEEKDQVLYSRDENAEYELPPELQGKVMLYKIELGMHRAAAQRLLEGADAVIVGEEIVR